jgi:TfoX/Sxy family transcriptional regulator of competence genes
MDKLSRARRIQLLIDFLPDDPAPEPGLYFGEHVVRVQGQLCLVVTLEGRIGIRATDEHLEGQLQKACGKQHWVAHGRVYEQWYLLPESVFQDDSQVSLWARQAAAGVTQAVATKPRSVSAGRQ